MSRAWLTGRARIAARVVIAFASLVVMIIASFVVVGEGLLRAQAEVLGSGGVVSRVIVAHGAGEAPDDFGGTFASYLSQNGFAAAFTPGNEASVVTLVGGQGGSFAALKAPQPGLESGATVAVMDGIASTEISRVFPGAEAIANVRAGVAFDGVQPSVSCGPALQPVGEGKYLIAGAGERDWPALEQFFGGQGFAVRSLAVFPAPGYAVAWWPVAASFLLGELLVVGALGGLARAAGGRWSAMPRGDQWHVGRLIASGTTVGVLISGGAAIVWRETSLLGVPGLAGLLLLAVCLSILAVPLALKTAGEGRRASGSPSMVVTVLMGFVILGAAFFGGYSLVRGYGVAVRAGLSGEAPLVGVAPDAHLVRDSVGVPISEQPGPQQLWTWLESHPDATLTLPLGVLTSDPTVFAQPIDRGVVVVGAHPRGLPRPPDGDSAALFGALGTPDSGPSSVETLGPLGLVRGAGTPPPWTELARGRRPGEPLLVMTPEAARKLGVFPPYEFADLTRGFDCHCGVDARRGLANEMSVAEAVARTRRIYYVSPTVENPVAGSWVISLGAQALACAAALAAGGRVRGAATGGGVGHPGGRDKVLRAAAWAMTAIGVAAAGAWLGWSVV